MPTTLGNALTLAPRVDRDRRVIAVTGARSYLGTALLNALEADPRYARTIALDIQEPDLPLPKALFFQVDLTQPTADAELARILTQESVDTLVHLALLSNPTHNGTWAHELEAIGTMQVLNACAAAQLHKVVLRSWTALYGTHPQNPQAINEDSERRGIPGSRFFEDKLEAERLTLRYAEENPASVVTILRTAPITGPPVDSFTTRYLRRPLALRMAGYDPLIQLLDCEDAVRALKIALDADFPGVFNIAADGVLPLSTVLAMLGRPSIAVPYTAAVRMVHALWLAQLIDLPPSFLDFLRYICIADCTRAERVMGFRARRNIQQTIAHHAQLDVPEQSGSVG